MSIIAITASLATLIIGWLLGQSSAFIDRRLERKQALMSVIAVLLEVRHRITSSRRAVDSMVRNDLFRETGNSKMNVNDQSAGLGNRAEIEGRLEEAARALAKYDPIMASNLRTQISIGIDHEEMIRARGINPLTAEFTQAIHARLETILLPHLSQLTIQVASLVDRRTKRQLQRYLQRPDEPVPGADEYETFVSEKLNEALKKLGSKRD